MSIQDGEDILKADFITRAEANGTPSNDSGRVPRLESDGRLDGHFTKNGFRPNAGATINGATLPVPVYQNKTDNEVYACDANDATKYKFIGFAISNSTDGNAINVQTNGIIYGFSGLDEGQKYYVSDTIGTIANSPGTHEILVGVAISPTALLIMRGPHRANGTTTLTDQGADENTTAYPVTLGFRPTIIRAYAVLNKSSNDAMDISIGTWINGTYAWLHMFHAGTSSSNGISNDMILFINGGVTHYEVSISNVTDTGFDFSVLQKVASPTDALIIWEAEGHL